MGPSLSSSWRATEDGHTSPGPLWRAPISWPSRTSRSRAGWTSARILQRRVNVRPRPGQVACPRSRPTASAQAALTEPARAPASEPPEMREGRPGPAGVHARESGDGQNQRTEVQPSVRARDAHTVAPPDAVPWAQVVGSRAETRHVIAPEWRLEQPTFSQAGIEARALLQFRLSSNGRLIAVPWSSSRCSSTGSSVQGAPGVGPESSRGRSRTANRSARRSRRSVKPTPGGRRSGTEARAPGSHPRRFFSRIRRAASRRAARSGSAPRSVPR